MRVLFFSRDYTTHDRRFLQKLSESEHQIFFLRLEDNGAGYERRPLPANVQLVDWEGGRTAHSHADAWLALMPSLEKVLAEVRPNLVHAGPVPSCGLMMALTGFRPLIVMSWGSDLLYDAERDPTSRWMAKFALERSDYLVCDCRAVARQARAITNVAPARTVQFPWGIDLNEYQPGKYRATMRRELGMEENFIVLSPRSWEPIYDIET